MHPSGCGEECVGEKEGGLCPRAQRDMEGRSYRFRQHGQLVAIIVAIIVAILINLASLLAVTYLDQATILLMPSSICKGISIIDLTS